MRIPSEGKVPKLVWSAAPGIWKALENPLFNLPNLASCPSSKSQGPEQGTAMKRKQSQKSETIVVNHTHHPEVENPTKALSPSAVAGKPKQHCRLNGDLPQKSAIFVEFIAFLGQD